LSTPTPISVSPPLAEPRRATGRSAGRAPAPPAHKLTEDVLVLAGIGVVLALALYQRMRPWLHLHAGALLGCGVGAALLAMAGCLLWLGRSGRTGRPSGTSSSAAGVVTRTRRRLNRRSLPTHGAGWAERADLRHLLVAAPPGDRIVLGRAGRSLLCAEQRQSVLLVGPTQSGKTSGVAIPAILEWRGPVVATSVKSDIVRSTIDVRNALGPVDVYDPCAATGLAPTGWSPLGSSRTWSGAKQMAAALCSVARADGGMEDAGFWYASAEKLLAPLLLAAASAGTSMSEVLKWVDEEEIREPLLALELAGVPEALRALRTSFAREDRQRSSVFATTETVLAAFSDPTVVVSTLAPSLDPGALVDGGQRTLYCCAPARDQERLRPVFVALIRQVIDTAFERSVLAGSPLDPPLLVVLDEAANIAPLADLDTILSTAASHGIHLLTVWQDMAQIEARYGRRWSTIVNNHRAKVLCPGIADPLTLDHVSALIGDSETSEVSTTVGDDGRRSRTESSGLRRVAPSSVLRQLPSGEAVVVYGALPPARVKLRPHYER
jgi:type IV secretion system protein VirD4